MSERGTTLALVQHPRLFVCDGVNVAKNNRKRAFIRIQKDGLGLVDLSEGKKKKKTKKEEEEDAAQDGNLNLAGQSEFPYLFARSADLPGRTRTWRCCQAR